LRKSKISSASVFWSKCDKKGWKKSIEEKYFLKMAKEKRSIRPDASIILPDLAELQTDDLGLVSVTASRRFTFENRDGLHKRPAETIQNLSYMLKEDYRILSWMSKPTGGSAQMSSVLDMLALGVNDQQEVIVDLRGPKAYGIENLQGVLGLLGKLLRDSRSLEDVSYLAYQREARKILGTPMNKP
jgi:phosphotransferase system HPr-like phosphotransfer protein